MDTDGLALVNESYGYDVGDRLLVQMARQGEAASPNGALVARVDGGRSGVLCRRLPGANVRALAHRLTGAAMAVDDGGPGCPTAPRLGARVGVATAAADGPELLARADLALEEARRQGPQAIVVFDDELARRTSQRRRLRTDLQGVVARGELDVRYQPIVALPSERLIRLEARICWRHPRLGTLDASQFLDLAEETGDVVSFDLWMLHRACDQLARWRQARPEVPMAVAVNVSARVVTTPGFAERVTGMLQAISLPSSSLCLRVDAGVPTQELDAITSALRQLRRAGVRLTARNLGNDAIAAVLRVVRPDFVSLDGRSVARLGVEPVDTALVEALIGAGRRLGLVAVAEGVATPEQRDNLVALGCGAAQGPLWTDPLSTDAAGVLLEATSAGSGADQWSTAWRPLSRIGTGDEPRHPDGMPDRTRDYGPVFAYLSHEFRTPLQVVQSFVELLRDRVADDPVGPPGAAGSGTEALAGIERSVSRMEGLVSSLNDVTDIDDRSLKLHCSAVDVAGLVRQLVADQKDMLADRVITVDAANPTMAVIDADRVAQALTNLLANAGKFSPPGASIDVTVVGDASTIAVHVVDRGPGIPLQRVPDSFRPFVTFDASHRGVGLGLYLARGMAEAHGGELHYRRAHTGGAEFILVLPATASHHANAGWPVAGSESEPTPRLAACRPTTVPSSAPVDEGDCGRDRVEAAGLLPVAASAETAHDRVTGGLQASGRSGVLADVGLASDADALRAVLRATERLLAVETLERAVDAAIDLVVELGGDVLVDGDPVPPGWTAIADISLEARPALWAVAETVSAARIRVEAVLPAFVKAARVATQHVRRRSASAHIDPTTGFLRGPAAQAVVDSADDRDVVVMARAGPQPRSLVSMARVIRSRASADRCLLVDPTALVGSLTDATAGMPARATAGLRSDLVVVVPVADAAMLIDAVVAHAARVAVAGNGPTVTWVSIGPRPPGAPNGAAALQRCRQALDEHATGTIHAG